jgi:GntR family transcriptional regulator, transcriptional repressor for pyruvate dehydrogenase complex
MGLGMNADRSGARRARPLAQDADRSGAGRARPLAHGAKPIRGASEQVAVLIQHHIQREGLGPGEFLGREEDLAAEFGVSRPTLREALKLLASGNLIRATKGPGGGIFVARTAEEGISRSVSDSIAMMLETGAATLEELLDARLLLEVPIAGHAAHRADAALVQRLREAVEAETRADPDDREALAAADDQVHRTVAAAAGNGIAEALIGWVFEVLQPSLVAKLDGAVLHSAIVEQHRALLAAMEKGDPARAERAMKDHLLYLRDVLRMVELKDGGG